MSSAQHTPEPWFVQASDYPGGSLIKPIPGQVVAQCDEVPEMQANARRIVAAVNACKSISTEAPEQGVVAELRRALELFLQFNDQWLVATDSQADLEHDRVMQIAGAAIGKANGRPV